MMPNWNKACEIEDFADAAIAGAIRRVFPEEAGNGAYRKHWEIAMAGLAAETLLPPERRVRALGVGAGKEATLFYLTNIFEEVVASDLYHSTAWPLDSPAGMLTHPERYARGMP